MRLTRKYSGDDTPPLTPTVTVVLLGGWAAEPAEGRPHGFGDGLFDLFQRRHEGLVALWREHEDFLRAEAVRRGIEPAWPSAGSFSFVPTASAKRGLRSNSTPNVRLHRGRSKAAHGRGHRPPFTRCCSVSCIGVR